MAEVLAIAKVICLLRKNQVTLNADVISIYSSQDRIKNINELPALLEFLLDNDASVHKYETENFGQWDAKKVERYGTIILAAASLPGC